MKPTCIKCEVELVNIEYSHSSYNTWACPNKDCTEHGKAQKHERKV